MTRSANVALSACSVLVGVLALAAVAQAESRGELLYSTHCIACHTSQAHWRDKKVATDWISLKAEVQRWQATAMLQWNEEDVLEVTRYLNDTFYRFQRTTDRLSSLGAGRSD
jgi:mono/diheme cytochrome c family protein